MLGMHGIWGRLFKVIKDSDRRAAKARKTPEHIIRPLKPGELGVPTKKAIKELSKYWSKS